MTEKAAPGLPVSALGLCGVAFKSDCLKAFLVGSEGMLLFHRSGGPEGPFMANGMHGPQSFSSGTQISRD